VGCRDNITGGICRKSSGDGFEVPSLTDFRNRYAVPTWKSAWARWLQPTKLIPTMCSGDHLPPSPPAEKGALDRVVGSATAKPRHGATVAGLLRSVRGARGPPSEPQQSAKQARNRDHDSTDPCGQTKKQQKIAQKHRHIAPPLCRAMLTFQGIALRPRPDCGTSRIVTDGKIRQPFPLFIATGQIQPMPRDLKKQRDSETGLFFLVSVLGLNLLLLLHGWPFSLDWREHMPSRMRVIVCQPQPHLRHL
jgi:hypothetical protein